MRVDVSADRGKTWHVAELDAGATTEQDHQWSWTLWTAAIPVTEGVKKVHNNYFFSLEGAEGLSYCYDLGTLTQPLRVNFPKKFSPNREV